MNYDKHPRGENANTHNRLAVEKRSFFGESGNKIFPGKKNTLLIYDNF